MAHHPSLVLNTSGPEVVAAVVYVWLGFEDTASQIKCKCVNYVVRSIIPVTETKMIMDVCNELEVLLPLKLLLCRQGPGLHPLAVRCSLESNFGAAQSDIVCDNTTSSCDKFRKITNLLLST